MFNLGVLVADEDVPVAPPSFKILENIHSFGYLLPAAASDGPLVFLVYPGQIGT